MTQADNTKIAKAVLATAVAAFGVSIAFLARKGAKSWKNGKDSKSFELGTSGQRKEIQITPPIGDSRADTAQDTCGESTIANEFNSTSRNAIGEYGSAMQTAYSEIRSECNIRRIRQLVHFTRVDRLQFIAKEGIISNSSVRRLGRPAIDGLRLDGKPDYICTSITHPNYLMFYKYSIESREDWCVITINPAIMWTRNCLFYPYNAASLDLSSQETPRFTGPEAFANLFAQRLGSVERDPNISLNMPTSPQAEVLIPGSIPPEEILVINFFNETVRRRYIHLLDSESIASACHEDYYKPRTDWRIWS